LLSDLRHIVKRSWWLDQPLALDHPLALIADGLGHW
jgi:hypothetical protein